jgi:hypothetical protein
VLEVPAVVVTVTATVPGESAGLLAVQVESEVQDTSVALRDQLG